MLLTAVVALVVYFLPTPAGIESYTRGNSYAEFVWFDNASGVVEWDASQEATGWLAIGPISGDRSVVCLNWGILDGYGRDEDTTIQIQLPSTFYRWQKFDLQLLKTNRTNYPTPTEDGSKQSLMDPSEIAFTYLKSPKYEGPTQESIRDFKGSLTILGSTESTVTISLHLPNLGRLRHLGLYGLVDEPQILTLRRHNWAAK